MDGCRCGCRCGCYGRQCRYTFITSFNGIGLEGGQRYMCVHVSAGPPDLTFVKVG